jgi:hypothetical protein
MAHTAKILLLGFLLLAICLVVGRTLGGSGAGVATGAKVFIPLWFIGAGINMWFGVAKAGYSVADEAPIFVLVFAIPALAAGFAAWMGS